MTDASTHGRPDAKTYLGYLDKEMTIMGILSGFSVAALSAVLLKIVGAEDADEGFGLVRAHGVWLTLLGSAFALGAALGFYRQRSRLAWHYGQIALALSRPDPPEPAKLNDLLDDADSWPTWIQYRWAFFQLAVGLAGFVVALARTAAAQQWKRVAESSVLYWLVPYCVLAGIVALVMYRVATIMEEDPYAEDLFAGRGYWGLGSRPTAGDPIADAREALRAFSFDHAHGDLDSLVEAVAALGDAAVKGVARAVDDKRFADALSSLFDAGRRARGARCGVPTEAEGWENVDDAGPSHAGDPEQRGAPDDGPATATHVLEVAASVALIMNRSGTHAEYVLGETGSDLAEQRFLRVIGLFIAENAPLQEPIDVGEGTFLNPDGGWVRDGRATGPEWAIARGGRLLQVVDALYRGVPPGPARETVEQAGGLLLQFASSGPALPPRP